MKNIFIINCKCEECRIENMRNPRISESAIPKLMAILQAPTPNLRELAAAIAS
jgi:hypothetical protein